MRKKPEIEITILGSGTFVPELKRHCSSYLIKIGDKNLVFDFGRGTLDQLMKVGVEYCDIDTIFISHTHTDHFSEIIALLQTFLDFVWTNFPKPNKLNKLQLKDKEIIIYGPKGIKKTISLLLKTFSFDKNKYVNKIKIRELSNGDVVKREEYKIKNFKVGHLKQLNSLAYRIESHKKILAYSGDTIDCIGLRKACMNADMAIIEATLPKKLRVKAHISPEEVGKVSQESNVKSLVLTHTHSMFIDTIKKGAKNFYKGPLIIAKDLMKINV